MVHENDTYTYTNAYAEYNANEVKFPRNNSTSVINIRKTKAIIYVYKK